MRQAKSKRPWQIRNSEWKLIYEYSRDPEARQLINLRHVNGVVVKIHVAIYGEDSGMRVYREDAKPVTKSDIAAVAKLLAMEGLWG